MTLSSLNPEPLLSELSQEDLIPNIARILTEITVENAKVPDKKQTIFDSKTIPTITMADYLNRLVKFTFCSYETLIIALVYLDRVFKAQVGVFPCDTNFHRFLLIALVVGIKFTEDKYYKNDYYAKVGGISVKELNKLEIEFLLMIDFRLLVDFEQFCELHEKIKEKG